MNKRKTNRYIVIGLGNFGSGVAESLHAKGHEVVAVDVSERAVDRIGAHVTRAVLGDGRQVGVLEQVGAKDADAAIISTGDDLAASVLSTLAVRDLGIREIYAKVISRDHARIMDQLGVTETIFPERESAVRLAERIVSTEILNYVRIGKGFSLQELAVPERWIGKTLRELELPRRRRVSVLAVHDVLNDAIAAVPDPDAPLKESDTVIVAGADEDLERVVRVAE